MILLDIRFSSRRALSSWMSRSWEWTSSTSLGITIGRGEWTFIATNWLSSASEFFFWIMITSFPRHLLSEFVWNEVLILCNIWSSWMSNEAHFSWQWIMKPLWKSAYTRLDPCSSLHFHLPLPKVKWRHITEHWPTAHLPL